MASKSSVKSKSTGRAKSSKPVDSTETTSLKRQIETLKTEVAVLKNNFDISKLPKDMVREQDLAGMMQESYTKTLDELNKLKKEKGVVPGSDVKALEEKLQKTSRELSDCEKKRKTAEEDLHVNKRRLIELEKELGQNQNSNSNGTDSKLIDELKEKIAQLSSDNDRLMKDLMAVREHNNDLKRKYEQLQQSSNNSNKNNTTQNEPLSDLQQQLTAKDREIVAGRTRYQQVQDSLDELSQNNSAQAKLVAKLEKQLADKDREMEEEKKRFEQVHYELSVQRNTMDSENSKQEEEIHKLHRNIHDLEQKVKILTESKDGVDDQRQALLQQSEELKNEHESEVSKLRESHKRQTEELNKKYEAEASKLRNELEDNKSTIDNLKVTTAQLQLRIQELEEQAAQRGNTVNVDEDSSRFRAMIQELQTELEVVKGEREAAKMEIKQHKLDLHAAFVNIDKKEKEIKNMEKAHKELVERKEKTINSLRRESSNVDPTVNQQIRSLKEENEALQTRISQLAGAKLQDANPGITDLSDENRPTKLGEKFSELYDNEWTEAYEEQEETIDNEQKTIEYLYKLLLDIYSYCQTVARKHAENLQKACTLLSVKTSNSSKVPEIHLIQKKLLKDVLKSFASCQVNDVIQNYLETNKSISKTQPQTMGFIHKALEVCWFMAVQDPPVILETQAKPTDNFDADVFKVYTKKGTKIDYIVWPPIRLHKDGHLIGKGVAQGK